MNVITISLPSSFYSNVATVNNLLKQFKNVTPLTELIEINTTNLKWIDGEACGILATLMEATHASLPNVGFNLLIPNNMRPAHKLLINNNMFPYYVKELKKIKDRSETVIRFTVITLNQSIGISDADVESINSYLETEVYSHPEWINSFQKHSDSMDFESSLYELVSNISDHSRSQRLLLAGQFYPQKREFRLSISDIGIGIPTTVQSHTTNKSDVERINWATEKGNTSRTKDPQERGIGLSGIIKSLKNRGELTIISKKGFWHMQENGNLIKEELSNDFPGTYIKIVFKRTH